MRSQHAQVSNPVQLLALIQAGKQSVDCIPATACPLCPWEDALGKISPEISATETLVVTLDQFRRHLGSHMEQLALFALPRNYKDEADSNEAAAVAHSDTKSRDFVNDDAISWQSGMDHETNHDPNSPMSRPLPIRNLRRTYSLRIFGLGNKSTLPPQDIPVSFLIMVWLPPRPVLGTGNGISMVAWSMAQS